MCGRYNLIPNATAWIDGFDVMLEILDEIEWLPRYNIAPGELVPIIYEEKGKAIIQRARWGFVPGWVKEDHPKIRPVNCRDDGVATKPYFRTAFKKQRCVFPASGYYEWRTEGRRKLPYNIVRKDRKIMLMAGIYDDWHDERGAAIITTGANELTSKVHDRMPVIIPGNRAMDWLTTSNPSAFLQQFPSDEMEMYPVSTDVNKAGTEGPNLIKEV